MAPQRDPAAACHSGALFATSRADYLSLDRGPPTTRSPPRRSLAGGRDMGRDFAIRPVLAGWGAFTLMRRPTNRRAKLQTLARSPAVQAFLPSGEEGSSTRDYQAQS